MAAITPPWSAEERKDGWYVFAIATNDRKQICGPLDRDTAHLIAAAHPLLLAVKALMNATPASLVRARRIGRNAVRMVEG